ncbi:PHOSPHATIDYLINOSITOL N-ACETYLGLUCOSAMINYLTRANSFERASE SUBUNIT Q, putative [Babesia bigemina]|uniref:PHOSPHATIDYLINOSITOL N-ACETYLGLUCOSAMINYLTRANSFERASE SUBUNIT Q, putative n=1 Tax=Babesia bigemina TaxID=5866 RepID=A0A061DEK5_BABBI|nr:PHOSPHATIDYLINOSITOL N-ACETYLGLUCOSAMINYLTRANSFERASE SUBUNIT Q, putative [Babesia bigemina]CDR97440.1 PHOSPHATIDYLINOSITOL N-ACETYLGLUCOSAMINYLTRANSFERASE SUBUNIT Q, putative [Babesia bigemina]|eukprot:XP_012769626.1 PHOSPHATIDYLINOSITOL N-ACETYLGLUCOSAMINYLTRANSFERASE SUBUNIT Q, putative [Babesia bigemina]
MDNHQATVYLPAEDYRRVCAGDDSRLLVGWHIPVLRSTVAISSYPSCQERSLRCALQELAELPTLRHEFCRHGNLRILDISLTREHGGICMQSSDGNREPVQVVKYAVEDFGVVSFAELLTICAARQERIDAHDGGLPRQMRLSSYLITGCALLEYLDTQMHARIAESDVPKGSGDLAAFPPAHRKRHTRCEIAVNVVCQWMVQLVLYMSLCAQWVLSAASVVRCKPLHRTLNQLTIVSVISKRLTQMQQWQERYRELYLQDDIVDYLDARHSLRQSAWSVVTDVLVGVLQVLFFRRTVVYAVNYVRAALREVYVSTFKYTSYHFAMRIGKYCKLNNEVAVFVSRLLLSVLVVWRIIKPRIQAHFTVLSNIFQYSALFGVTCHTAVLVDILTIETMHVAYAHCIMLYLTKWMQRYLYSLLQLFKGKKWNVLKQSLDSNNYTREQLFLGTVIFTLLLLIYPTIWVFYCVTLLVYLPVFVARAFMRSVIEVMTKFPWYFLAYNALFPRRYKEGVYFVAHNHDTEGSSHAAADGADSDAGLDGEGLQVARPGLLLEMRCTPFSPRTVVQPMLKTLKSCCGSLNFWKSS